MHSPNVEDFVRVFHVAGPYSKTASNESDADWRSTSIVTLVELLHWTSELKVKDCFPVFWLACKMW